MRKSFTLIELIVVIAIIAVLAAIIAPNAFRAITKAQVARVAADMKTIKAVLLTFYADTGKFTGAHYFKAGGTQILEGPPQGPPPCDSCLNLSTSPLLANEANTRGWDGPYVERVLKSPLHHEYVNATWSLPGYYYIGGTSFCYPSQFDLDGNGTLDTPFSVAVFLPGITDLKLAYAVDRIFDPQENTIALTEGQQDIRGIMNVQDNPVAPYYDIWLYVGHGGATRGVCDP